MSSADEMWRLTCRVRARQAAEAQASTDPLRPMIERLAEAFTVAAIGHIRNAADEGAASARFSVGRSFLWPDGDLARADCRAMVMHHVCYNLQLESFETELKHDELTVSWAKKDKNT